MTPAQGIPGHRATRNGSAVASACEDARVTEYGRGVGESAGRVGGSTGGGGGGGDWGGNLVAMGSDAVDTVLALPAEQLLLLFVVVLAGLFVLKRAL